MYTVLGGVVAPAFKIEFRGVPPVAADDMLTQQVQTKSLGLPQINLSPKHIQHKNRRLAIIGGGPSINDREDQIRNWDGDIWSIGGAYRWCFEKGIKSTFIACDPHIIVAQWAENVTDAIVTSRCHPKVFEVLAANNAKVKTFDLEGDEQIVTGSSTATAIPHMSGLEGYTDVTYFGCESSFSIEKTHAYMREERAELLLILCGGEVFLTAPDFLMQAQELAFIVDLAPHAYKEESGGLLRAMINAKSEYQLLWVSEGMKDRLRPKE